MKESLSPQDVLKDVLDMQLICIAERTLEDFCKEYAALLQPEIDRITRFYGWHLLECDIRIAELKERYFRAVKDLKRKEAYRIYHESCDRIQTLCGLTAEVVEEYSAHLRQPQAQQAA